MPVIMGTAGHIDHGKTSLIRALTGMDCDRLAEEKKRGITIELGFAYLDLGDDHRLGIVDVPGHEKFVKNMVAGAAGVDFVALVIAADEGIMPQTREHLEICSLLGVREGLVVLTKADMVDEEWMEMVQEEVRDYLAPTFLAEAPVFAVSSITGQGIDELKAELKKVEKTITPRRSNDLFRLPIDRTFTMKGHGTVVTGTLVSGSVSVGENIVVYPVEAETKVRNLQSHGASVESVPAGQRTAVNLQGVEVDDLARGMVLARKDTLFPTDVWDVELTCLESAPLPIKNRKEVHFHHGAKETAAKVFLLDRDVLAPGETAICQMRFTEPMCGIYGDRVVLRSHSPLRTIAGGRLINPLGRKMKRKTLDVEKLSTLTSDKLEDVLLTQLELSGFSGVDMARLLVLTNSTLKKLEKCLQSMGGKQQLFCFDKDTKSYAHGGLVVKWLDEMIAFILDFHKQDSTRAGVSRSELQSNWGRFFPPKLFHFLVEKNLKGGEIVADGDVIRHKKHKVSLASDQEKLRELILAAYAEGGVTPPNVKDVLEPANLSFKECSAIFRVLCDEGSLIKIKEQMYYHPPAMETLKGQIVEFLTKNESIEPSDVRDLTGLSRKFTIPILEYLDKERVTMRVEDRRILRKK
ncbi:MAG: selenocysteine-specific translation elongation factor [Desulfovibrio sp.]